MIHNNPKGRRRNGYYGDINVSWLAKTAGVHYTNLCAILSGKIDPRFSTACRVADVLEISLDEFRGSLDASKFTRVGKEPSKIVEVTKKKVLERVGDGVEFKHRLDYSPSPVKVIMKDGKKIEE